MALKLKIAGKRRVKKVATKQEKLVEKLFKNVPDADLREVLDSVAQDDPVTWTMLARRLRGKPLVYDIADELDKLEAERAKATRPFTEEEKREYKTRLLQHRPFLIEPLGDTHPWKVYRKSRQVGVSELSITETLWFLDSHKGVKAVYCFPRDQQLKDFSNTRIDPALMETPKMRRLLTGTDQVYGKMVGSSHLLLRSAWESNLGEGIDADSVTLDEKDRMKQGVDVAFRESLKSSRFGWYREVSTPTLPGAGVDASFMMSDQRYWFVKCKKCGKEQTPDWPENVIQVKDIPLGAKELESGTYEFRCSDSKCHGELDRYRGRWVAKYPTRNNVRGYQISQLSCPWINATQLMQDKINYKFQNLWENYCLGRTSKGDSVLVSAQDFLAATAQYQPVRRRDKNWTHISVGIDWGATNWCVVLGKNAHNNRTYVLDVIVIEDDPTNELAAVNEIISRLAPYDPDIVLADHGYGKDRNPRLSRAFQHKFYAALYNPSGKNSRTFQPSWQDASEKVLCDRTITLKVMCAAWRERQIGLMPSSELQAVELLQKHILNLAPVKQEEDGEIWEEIGAQGDDHLAHAMGYAFLGLDKRTHSGQFNFGFL